MSEICGSCNKKKPKLYLLSIGDPSNSSYQVCYSCRKTLLEPIEIQNMKSSLAKIEKIYRQMIAEKSPHLIDYQHVVRELSLVGGVRGNFEESLDLSYRSLKKLDRMIRGQDERNKKLS